MRKILICLMILFCVLNANESNARLIVSPALQKQFVAIYTTNRHCEIRLRTLHLRFAKSWQSTKNKGKTFRYCKSLHQQGKAIQLKQP